MGQGQVFIEDYAISLLKKKKTEAVAEPIRLALFGYTEKKEEEERFVVYGVACEEEGRTIEEIGEEFFPGYNFLGFVNVFDNEQDKTSQYKIFFDENEAMQDYLLYDDFRSQAAGTAAGFDDSPLLTNKRSSGRIGPGAATNRNGFTLREGLPAFLWDKLELIILGILCIILAVAISTIDDYTKMKNFTQSAEDAIVFIDETG